MRLLLTILTCQQRKPVLADTLASLKQTDWDTEPLIWNDPNEGSNLAPAQRQVDSSYRLLQHCQDLNFDYLVFTEDDVIHNRHLKFNLLNWQPIRYGFGLIGSLYNSSTRPAVANYYEIQPGGIGGSQGIVIKRCWIQTILDKWNDMHKVWLQDIRIYRSLYGSGQRVLVHTPNLINHRQVESTWKGSPHTSADFNIDWHC